MIFKTALAAVFVTGAVSLGHQALDRVNRTEMLANNIVASAKASAAGVPSADTKWKALRDQAWKLANTATPAPAATVIPIADYDAYLAQEGAK